jgi:P-type E1-E2 ATPase
VTPLSPQTPFVSVAPLCIVLAISGIKEAIEDYQRYKMDKQINESVLKCWRDGAFRDVAWQDVVVGDICYVVADKPFPADLLIVKTSGQQGACTIETSNLDGCDAATPAICALPMRGRAHC